MLIKDWRRTRGLALAQVLMAVGVATLIGTAMLAGTSLQVQATYNHNRSSQTQLLAESGVNLAMYYLDHPEKAPTLNSSGYWPGGANIVLDPSIDGRYTVTVQQGSAQNEFNVSSTGVMGEISRNVRATVRTHDGIPIKRAVSFNAAAVIGTNLQISGPVQVAGNVTLSSGATLNGNLYSTGTALLSGTLNGVWQQVPSSEIHIPSVSTLKDYRTYSIGGTTYNATPITTASLGGATAVTLGPTASNPAGIYVFQGDPTASPPTAFSLAGNVTINGTLLVRDAELVINGLANNVVAQSGYPAVIAYKDVKINGRPRSATFRGVTWIGGSVKSALISSGSTLDIDGALFFGGSGGVNAACSGVVRVTYNASRVSVPQLDKRYQTGGPTLVSWGD